MLYQWREALVGAGLGALIGGVWFVTGSWHATSPTRLFPGESVVVIAALFGLAGFLLGEQFTETLKRWWHLVPF